MLSFLIYVRLNPGAQVKIGALMQIETKLREVRMVKGVGRRTPLE